MALHHKPMSPGPRLAQYRPRRRAARFAEQSLDRSHRPGQPPAISLVGWVGQRALQNLRERIYTHLQSMSLGFLTPATGPGADLAG